MYIDLFYGIEELDEEIINKLYTYQLYHYHSCYILVQYYDRQAYNMILSKLPNSLTVLPEKIVVKQLKEVGAENLSELIDSLKSYTKMTINELSKYCSSREECEKIYKRYSIIYNIYRLKNVNLDEITTFNLNLNKNKYE